MLSPSDFAEFWRQAHPELPSSASPFPWQQRLVNHIADTRHWPNTISVPTGLGKTTALDVAVFTLALSRAKTIAVRMPTRIFLVVDRKVIVDSTYEHAVGISDALKSAQPGTILAEVAELLRPAPLTSSDRPAPLVAGRMRGGVTWAWRWLDRPDQPAIVTGTIDQLGSRILFNGYGVGQNLTSIDAALTGIDSLVLVDEAHLAGAFVSTLRSAQAVGAPTSDELPMAPATIVTMSATSHDTGDHSAFTADETTEADSPTALGRLHAAKTMVNVEVKATRTTAEDKTATAMRDIALHLGQTGGVVGIIANTVLTARKAFDFLCEVVPEPDRAVLVTGRQRQIDRDEIWSAWKDHLEVGRPEPKHALYVVTTQTIEVGADLDFSALVTESCALDALTQRLGRLNRVAARSSAKAVLVHPSSVTDDDPVYGPARRATWEWLTSIEEARLWNARRPPLEGGYDVSPTSLARQLTEERGEVLRPLMAAEPLIPVFFPGILDRWVRTSPRPTDSPDVDSFLHGIRREQPTVNLVWRAIPGTDVVRELSQSVALLPVSPDEQLEVPLSAAATWLSGTVDARNDMMDAADTGTAVVLKTERTTQLRPAVVVCPDGSVAELQRLSSAMTVAVPTSYGGIDAYGWAPASTAPALDVADLARRGRHGSARRVLRLGGPNLNQFVRPKPLNELLRVVSDAREEGDSPEAACKAAIKAVLNTDDAFKHTHLDDTFRELLMTSAKNGKCTWGSSIAMVGVDILERSWVSDNFVMSSSASRAQVTFEDHSRAVGDRARLFARELELPKHLVEAVGRAGELHDLGKLDPRFQVMLNGGVFPPPEPLAKSDSASFATPQSFPAIREAAGYPAGMRHEAYSAFAVNDLCGNEPERELITHLVASHHGRARPLGGAVFDAEPVEYRIHIGDQSTTVSSCHAVDWDQPQRFSTLNQRLGPWGLALLETVLRLADIGCSSEGS